MSVDIAWLRKFNDSLSLPRGYTLNENGTRKFQDNCNEIIKSCSQNFPAECGQICLLLQMLDAKIISVQQAVGITNHILTWVIKKWAEQVKPPKIFISHATDDKIIVDKLVALLEKMGVKNNQLFCSSIQGYGIPQGSGDLYQYIRNEMSNDNIFVIMMLSKNYYNSPVCLNEMGAAWIKQSAYQSILLPDFDYIDVKGSINPRDISFKLSDLENRTAALNEFKDRIISHLGLEPIEHTIWERFRDTFVNEIDQIIVSGSNNHE